MVLKVIIHCIRVAVRRKLIKNNLHGYCQQSMVSEKSAVIPEIGDIKNE